MENDKNGDKKVPLLEETENKRTIGLKLNANDKKIKNLISALILLAGLFVGSLFVDVLQMVRGRGFSQKALEKTDIIVLDGRTWVAYKDPVIRIKVFSEETCEKCAPDQFLVWLRRLVPTMLSEKIDVSSESGKKVAEEYGIKSIPSFIFSKDIEKTDFFGQAKAVFAENKDGYLLKNEAVGINPGKFIVIPSISEKDVKIGPAEAKVKLIEFSDFQCPYCKTFQIGTVDKLLQEYGDKIMLVYKNLPLDFHAQAESAALAALCANEQQKFQTYSRKLFETQEDWGKATDTRLFKTYALQIGLKASDFNKCLDDKKYLEQIETDKQEASNFGISGTPAIFINNQFKSGAASYDEVKAIIEEELAK